MGSGGYGKLLILVYDNPNYMAPERQAQIQRLCNELQAKGFEPEVFYHSPGGKGPEVFQDIAFYLNPDIWRGVVSNAMWDTIKALRAAWLPTLNRSQTPIARVETANTRAELFGGDGERITELHIIDGDVQVHYKRSDIPDEDENVR